MRRTGKTAAALGRVLGFTAVSLLPLWGCDADREPDATDSAGDRGFAEAATDTTRIAGAGKEPDQWLSLIHISEPTRLLRRSRMPSSA